MGHYVVVCSEKKNKKEKDKPMASFAEIESFDRDFGFIARPLVQDHLPDRFRGSVHS